MQPRTSSDKQLKRGKDINAVGLIVRTCSGAKHRPMIFLTYSCTPYLRSTDSLDGLIVCTSWLMASQQDSLKTTATDILQLHLYITATNHAGACLVPSQVTSILRLKAPDFVNVFKLPGQHRNQPPMQTQQAAPRSPGNSGTHVTKITFARFACLWVKKTNSQAVYNTTSMHTYVVVVRPGLRCLCYLLQ